MKTDLIFVGLDLSLNHFGLVTLYPDESSESVYLYPVKKYVITADDPKITGFLTIQKGSMSHDKYTLERQKQISSIITSHLQKLKNYVVGIEGYSYGSVSESICQLAEIGGVIKLWVYQNGGKLKIIDPTSLKLFTTGQGSALKKDIVQFCKKHNYRVPDVLFRNITIRRQGKKLNDLNGPGTDLCDAFSLAFFLQMIQKVWNGQVTLDSLPESQQKVFFRTTKKNPINILGDGFIEDAKEDSN